MQNGIYTLSQKKKKIKAVISNIFMSKNADSIV